MSLCKLRTSKRKLFAYSWNQNNERGLLSWTFIRWIPSKTFRSKLSLGDKSTTLSVARMRFFCLLNVFSLEFSDPHYFVWPLLKSVLIGLAKEHAYKPLKRLNRIDSIERFRSFWRLSLENELHKQMQIVQVHENICVVWCQWEKIKSIILR